MSKLDTSLHVWKLYLALLERFEGTPDQVLKVGITSSSDAMRRLTYQGADEPNPIVGTFPKIRIMHSVWLATREEAEWLESLIMKNIAGNGRFHNWYEPRQLSGITEMRIWDFNEYKLIRAMMDKHGHSFQKAKLLNEQFHAGLIGVR